MERAKLQFTKKCANDNDKDDVETLRCKDKRQETRNEAAANAATWQESRGKIERGAFASLFEPLK